MEDKTVTRIEHFPVTTMEDQEQIEYQQVEKTDYVAVEKISYHYSGCSDAQRGAQVGTVPGESRVLGTSHVENGPIRGTLPSHPLGPYGGLHGGAYPGTYGGPYRGPYGGHSFGSPYGHPAGSYRTHGFMGPPPPRPMAQEDRKSVV